ncbi:MAG TPA: contact-dependent growth inhibition system immunity protein [Gemmatirosa sp.]|nr:contact-dependent growth inhibition system immunity protein [Gemmatirosa sp.]
MPSTHADVAAVPRPPGPPPPPPGLDPALADRSVAELEGLAIEKGAFGIGSVAWLSRALVSPLRDLGPAELRLLLAHGRGLRWILPLALARLEQEPFVRAERQAGDLLSAVLMVDEGVWASAPAWSARLARVLHDARTVTHVLPASDRVHVEDELQAAREAFGF